MDEDLVIPRIDGAPDAVREIKESGFRIGLVTGKIKYFVEKHLREAGFDLDLFEAIASFESTRRHKPDSEPLFYVMNKLHVKPEETVYVGDAVSDYGCAETAGVRYVAVLTGSLERARLEEIGVKNIIQSVADLPAFLREALQWWESAVDFFRWIGHFFLEHSNTRARLLRLCVRTTILS